jgi:nucleoside-triphosphatase THEP1
MVAQSDKDGDVPGVRLAAMLHGGDQTGDGRIAAIAGKLKSQGYRVGGVVQSSIMQPGQCRCDMVLEELTGGLAIPISQSLGNQSQGCRLDSAALEYVVGLVEASVRNGLDILVLNKFGKQEVEGKGLRGAIAMAVEAAIPVLVGLNRTNIEAWNCFSGGEGKLLEPEGGDVENWLRAALPAPQQDLRTAPALQVT